jgi:hypothetical protein
MRISTLIGFSISLSIAVLAASVEISAQDKYTVKVPNGLAFSEFRGYEGWSLIAISENGGKIAAIVGNPAMIDAYKEGDLLPAFWTTPGEHFLIISRAGRGEKDHEGF